MATLTISDLSLGDWVMVNEKPRKIRTLTDVWDGKSEVLVGYVVMVYSNGHNVVHYKPIEKVKPIPITPEMLEANGWEKVSKVVYKWSNEKHRVFVWLKGFSHYIDVEEMDAEFDTKSSRIEVSQLYVHLLQHALRLAGVEKEIVMPNK